MSDHEEGDYGETGEQQQQDDEEEYVYSEDDEDGGDGYGEDTEMSESDVEAGRMQVGGVGAGSGAGAAASPSASRAAVNSSSSSSSSSGAGAGSGSAARSHGSHNRTGRLSISSSGIGAGSGQEYRLLRPEDVERERARVVHDLAGVLSVPEEAAMLLLSHFKWNRERALDAYTGDPEATVKAVGLEHFGQGGPPDSQFYCGVCMEDDLPPGQGYQLGCK